MKLQNEQFYTNGFVFENGEYRTSIRENVILKRDPTKDFWNVDVIKQDGSINTLKIDEVKDDEIREEIDSLIKLVGNPWMPGDEPVEAVYTEVETPKKTEWKKPPITKQLVKTKSIPLSMQDKQVQDLTLEDIKGYICQKATDSEAYMFLKLCQARGLNPFTKEAYLVKYGQDATMIVGKEAFTRKAEQHPMFDGFRAGIIVDCGDGEIEEREGTFLKPSEKLLGGWAEVFRKDRSRPFKGTVSLQEYNTNQSLWKTKPGTMIRKVALVQVLRECFPSEFSGMYDSSEIGEEVEASF